MLLSQRYSDIREAARVRERELFAQVRLPNELELQARWFAGEFGREFISSTGDQIKIIQLGTWNREAGPDFCDAAISINGEKPVIGCIEIDLLDRNWELHGHATNAAFDGTVLHIFVDKSDREFFTRTKSNRNVPQIRIDVLGLADAFPTNLPLARAGRCHAPLRGLPENQVTSVLDAAAQFRLQRKATRLRAKIDGQGVDETLFQEIAAALGYKENKLPFTLIAQRLPLKFLRKNNDDAEALLFGIAGFLEKRDLAVYTKSTKDYVRNLWDRWWQYRDEMLRLIVSGSAWRLSGTRPSNHPQRRLAALSMLVKQWPAFRSSLGKFNAAPLVDLFSMLDHPFWNRHYTLTAAPSSRKMALIGESRTAEILANVLFPFWLAQDSDRRNALTKSLWETYAKLPARLSNRRVETGAIRLFGDDPRRQGFLKTVAHQQGLLQIYEDFCLKDNSDCAQCPFPEQMLKWK